MIRALILAATALTLPVSTSIAEETAMVTSTKADTTQHAAWSVLLAKYIQPDDTGINRFDYAALKASDADVAALDAYVASFADMKISEMSEDEQFAAWANLYNALTVQHIIGRYPVKSIRSGYFIGPWKEVYATAEGEKVSLDDIEHEILREQWDEPRVHYAVNCASYGCPNLPETALEAATLDEQLDAGARAYINHPRGVTIRRNGTLQVSQIYKWFDEDFGGSKAKVVEHLLEYAEPELAAQIRANPKITKYAYDWSLNDVE